MLLKQFWYTLKVSSLKKTLDLVEKTVLGPVQKVCFLKFLLQCHRILKFSITVKVQNQNYCYSVFNPKREKLHRNEETC